MTATAGVFGCAWDDFIDTYILIISIVTNLEWGCVAVNRPVSGRGYAAGTRRVWTCPNRSVRM